MRIHTDETSLAQTSAQQAKGRHAQDAALAMAEPPGAAAQRRLQSLANASTRVQRSVQLAAVANGPAAHAAAPRPNATGLPDRLKIGIERLSGVMLDDVRVHRNSPVAASLQAHAFAQGTEIHLAPGQERHLPHEAWHVVQQKEGRVRPTSASASGVPINDDPVLEQEATRRGEAALDAGAVLQGQFAARMLAPPATPIVQRAWIEEIEEAGASHVWDTLVDGVRWFADVDGMMWYRLEDAAHVMQGRVEDYEQSAGVAHKRSWVAWNRSSVRPAPEFTGDLTGDYGLAFEDDQGDPKWADWDRYMRIAIGSAAESDQAADVRRNPDFDSTLLGPAEQYLAGFQIVDKQDFNIKLWEMAEALTKLGNYTCIVSEAGKSNFWLTARVLKKVQMLGGAAPRRIISVPAKEKGIKDAAVSYRLQLEDAGTIVFLDDGAYSGSQLANLIMKVMRDAQNDVRFGLVAKSRIADEVINKSAPRAQSLIDSIPIAEYPRAAELDKVQQDAGLTMHKPNMDAPHGDGNHMLGLYYKVPDFASIRKSLLTRPLKKDSAPALLGYQEAGFTVEEGVRIDRVPTEPYKAKLAEPLDTLSLEIAQPEQLHGRPLSARAGFGKGAESRMEPMRMRPAARGGLGLSSSATKPRALGLSRAPIKIGSASVARSGALEIPTTDPSAFLAAEDAHRVYGEKPVSQEMKGADGRVYLYVRSTPDGTYYFVPKD